MNRSDYSNSMEDQVFQLPSYMKQISDTVWEACRRVVTPEMKGLYAKHIMITGCGDSYCAGIAMKPALDAMLTPETSVEPVRAVQLSRQMSAFRLTPENPGDVLVVSISASGKPSRVVEGAMRASKCGAVTLALTSSEETPLAKECELVLEVPKPETAPGSPGILSYSVSCLGLCYFGIALGLARGNFSEEKALFYKKSVEEYCQSYEALLPQMADEMFELAKTFEKFEYYDFVGDCADFANAYFGSCKFAEAFGAYCSYDDSENWEHVNYFIEPTAKIGTVASMSSDSPSLTRQKEMIPVCKRIQRKLLVLTDLDKSTFPEEVTVAQVPSCRLGFIKPIMMHLPLSLLAAYIAALKGEPYFRGGKGVWAEPNDIANSKIEIK